MQLDFIMLVTLSRFTNLINISSEFQLEDLISGMNLLTQTEKEIESISSFKIVVKHKLLSLYNELSHF